MEFSVDVEMEQREALALEFYEVILAPDEEPAFVSDEAVLRDVSLAPDAELIRKVEEHYGCRLTTDVTSISHDPNSGMVERYLDG